jgi:hypothetical protein
MTLKRLTMLASMIAAFAIAFGMSSRASDNECTKFPDTDIDFYNGGSGEYATAFVNKAILDGNSWSSATAVDLHEVGGYGENDQINAFNANYGRVGWAGIMIPTFQGGSQCIFQHARVQANQYYLDNLSYQYKAFIACHELGHGIGLGHRAQTENTTCMREGGDSSALYPPYPDQIDIDNVNEKYGVGPGGPVTLGSGQSLFAGQSVHSGDGRFTLVYQGDGNLVLYRWDGVPLWSSGTPGTSPGEAAMQGDGNLVVYDGGGTPLWSSGTAGQNGAYLSLQDDGNMVIYSAGGVPLWSTGTCCY